MLGFLASTQPTRSGDRTTRLGDVYDGLRLRITFKTVSTKIAIALVQKNIALYNPHQKTIAFLQSKRAIA